MASIYYDRLIGPTTSTSVSDVTTTSLSVSAESAPTLVDAATYCNFVVQVSSPGSPAPTSPATCTDTQASDYTLIKEVLFGGFALDIFAKSSTSPNVSTTITTTHQESQHRIILCDEWYNLGNFEKVVSAYASTVNAQADVGSFAVGQKHWLVYAVLAIGGSAYSDSVTIPNNWNLLHDVGTNYGDGNDVRLVIAYQIANNRKVINFQPFINNARVWGGAMISYKAKL